MKIKILSSALDDLSEGRSFYEKQGEGLGEYFFDSLFSDIDSSCPMRLIRVTTYVLATFGE